MVMPEDICSQIESQRNDALLLSMWEREINTLDKSLWSMCSMRGRFEIQKLGMFDEDIRFYWDDNLVFTQKIRVTKTNNIKFDISWNE